MNANDEVRLLSNVLLSAHCELAQNAAIAALEQTYPGKYDMKSAPVLMGVKSYVGKRLQRHVQQCRPPNVEAPFLDGMEAAIRKWVAAPIEPDHGKPLAEAVELFPHRGREET
jgi:hypothetical protein